MNLASSNLSIVTFYDLITSLNLNSVKNEDILSLIPCYLNFTIDKFFIHEGENKLVINNRKKRFILLLDSLINNIDYKKFTDYKKLINHLINCINSNITSENDQILSVASGHLLLLIFYIERCKLINSNDPYNSSPICLDKNKIFYDHDFFNDVNYFDYKNNIDMQRDLLYDFSSFNIFYKLLLNDENKNFLELPQELFLILSIILAREKENTKLVKIIYDELSSKRISLATPILSNLRTKTFKNTASCFILKVQDELSKIFDAINDVAMISRAGGGVGINLSSIRTKGSYVSGRPNTAMGVMSCCKLLDVVSNSISQAGKRSAAITVALDIWHSEINEFLEINLESGDNRMKCFDLFPQVVVNDLFMKKVENAENWYLFNPKEILDHYKVDLSYLVGNEFDKQYELIVSDIENNLISINYHVVKATDLMKKIMQSQIETGLPYIFFKDNANRNNPNSHEGRILSGNLCQESFSNFGICSFEDGSKHDLYHTCNLASLNLSNILNDEALENSCSIAVKILDNIFSIKNPISKSLEHNNRYRTIGIGALGMHDHLAYKKIVYGSKESIDYVDKMFHLISYFTSKESINLARKYGYYPAYKGSQYEKGIINGYSCYDFEKECEDLSLNSKNINWSILFSDMKKYGIRNSQILAIAPNTSTSIFQNASASVLPVYNTFFLDSNSHSTVYSFPRFAFTSMESYSSYSKIELKKVINVIKTIQKHIDQGISFEILFDMNDKITAKYIRDTIFYIWKSKCKTIYYVRSIQKTYSNQDSICESCTL